MDVADENSGTLSEVRGNCDDKIFCTFYYKALKRLLDIDDKDNVSYLQRYFKVFCEYFNMRCQVKKDLEDYDDTIIDLLEDSLYYVVTYVYRNATLFSSAVAFHFRNVYKKNPATIDRLMRKKIVKICSIGGCAAADIVAMVTVLESIALKSGIELDFRVTIIESDERWKVACITILSCLQHFYKATWKITFVRGNCPKKNVWTSETSKAIEEADIITMTKSLSKSFIKNMKEIIDKVPHQAMLLILDEPIHKIIDLTFDLTNYNNLELIHKDLLDFHSLDIEAASYFQNLYQKHFGSHKQFQANTFCVVCIGVWIKTPPEIKSNMKIEGIFQSNVEKFNPKLSFLKHHAFTRWENWFKKQKEAAGWNTKGIRKCVLLANEKRLRILVELNNERKKLDILQKELSDTFHSLKNKENESDESLKKSLIKYLIGKSNYSVMKRDIYCSFLGYSKTCPVIF